MNKYVPRYWKPILVLLIITPILTELLTNNIPARQLFKPQLFLILITLGYGPVLILRELAVRWKLGVAGYIILGLVYGLYNEGLFAKTIFQIHVPNPSFNNYGVLFGINFTWTIVIIIFHAFYAFLFPVLFVNYFFPLVARKPWLDKKVWLIISAAFLIYISYEFLNNMHPPVTAMHFAFLIVVMIVLILLAKGFTYNSMFELRKIKLLPMLFYGFGFVVTVFTISNLLAASGINSMLFIVYMLAILGITILLLQKNSAVQSLLVFCLAAEISFALGALWVAKVNGSRQGWQTSICFVIIFLVGLIVIMKKKHDDFNQLA